MRFARNEQRCNRSPEPRCPHWFSLPGNRSAKCLQAKHDALCIILLLEQCYTFLAQGTRLYLASFQQSNPCQIEEDMSCAMLLPYGSEETETLFEV